MEDSDEETAPTVLALYHSIGCSYSQKVLMALYEKNMEFDSCPIDQYAGEHLEPFFIDINPKAEVPVLVDGETIIADSSKIIEYLDSKCDEDDIDELLPQNKEELDRVLRMESLFEKVPLTIVTFGAVYHSHLSLNAKITETEKELRSSTIKCGIGVIDSFIIKHPENEELYKEKKKLYRSWFSSIKDINAVKQELQNLEKIFDIIEEELIANEEDWWLCGPSFTIADISFAVLLHRVEHLGLMMWFFRDGNYPRIMKYYKQVQKRESFIETFKFDFADDETPGGIFNSTTLFVILALIVFVIVAACAYLKNH